MLVDHMIILYCIELAGHKRNNQVLLKNLIIFNPILRDGKILTIAGTPHGHSLAQSILTPFVADFVAFKITDILPN